jgi:hypothetical protein
MLFGFEKSISDDKVVIDIVSASGSFKVTDLIIPSFSNI